jgi:transcriptional regulator with XRE-family HTH domain
MWFTIGLTLENKNLLYGEFGARLAAARKRRHLSQAALGTLARFSRTSITNIERGRQAVQLHHVYTFASILAVDIEELCPKQSGIAKTDAGLPATPQEKYLQQAKDILDNVSTKSVTPHD